MNFQYFLTKKVLIIISLVSLMLYMIIQCRYYNNMTDDELNINYNKINAIITKNEIETKDDITNNDNNYVHNKKFRLKTYYKYNVDGIEYEKYFYNDDMNNKFLDTTEYLKTCPKYYNLKNIMIYYDNTRHHDSCINLYKIKRRKSLMFFYLSLIILFIIVFYIFIDQ